MKSPIILFSLFSVISSLVCSDTVLELGVQVPVLVLLNELHFIFKLNKNLVLKVAYQEMPTWYVCSIEDKLGNRGYHSSLWYNI